MDEGEEVQFVFCNVSQALDTVWHAEGLYVTKEAGIDGQLQDWFKDYMFMTEDNNSGEQSNVISPE